MSERPNLPKPVTSQDFYLYDMAISLRQLADPPAQESEVVELREPAVEKTPLPKEFPGKDALEAAGIAALEDVPRTGDGLTAIKGVGDVTANQILTWFTLNS